MRRRYKREVFASRIELVHKLIPNAFIGVDVIVGFPGETNEDFEDTHRFLESLSPSFLHIFPYSERANTPTVAMSGKVNAKTLNQRASRLNELCIRLHADFYLRNVGKNANVLFESSRHNSLMFGFTENYVKVETEYNKLLAGKIVPVRLTEIVASGNMQAELL